MTDNTAPGVYTQPGSDSDDVLGHSADRYAFDKLRATDDRTFDRALSAADDTDDVEGHRLQDRAQDRLQNTDEDDVEGHIRSF